LQLKDLLKRLHNMTEGRRALPRLVALLACCLLLLVGVASAGRAVSARTGVADVTCSNKSKLATWSDHRLAMLTIAVPVAETAVWQVTNEVQAGAGGVLLFGSKAPANLGAKLASLAAQSPHQLGILVMTDEEGGGVQRMANLVGSLPWPAWMGKHWTTTQIRTHVAAVASKMAAANVTMDLAPVVDVDGSNVAPGATNPDGWRSFSGRTGVVSRDGVAFMRGLRDSGVIAVLKHFPGLGGSSGNSDNGPAQTLPWSKLKSVAIPPFAKAIAAGAPAVMVANDTVPGLTGRPASLSRQVIVGELQNTLGFHGLVLTDAVSALAIKAAGYTIPQAAVQALRAGADMILFGSVASVGAKTRAIASAIVSAVRGGHLARGRLISAGMAVLAVRNVDLCST
jgi:beta-N-acetylhexosaminidase